MKAFLKTTKGKIIVGGAALLIILLIVLLITKVIGGDEGYRSISVSEISGSVLTENNGKKYEAYKNMRLADGYALTTDEASYTRMVLDGDKYVKLEEKSRALFESLGSDKLRKTAIRLEDGTLTTEITAPLGADEDYIVNTPNAVLAVRGTFFKAAVKYDTNGDAYTDVYTYGGTVVCKRVMPDGTIVEEEVMIKSGYKACVKMDEVITVYVEELIEEQGDNVDPIDIKAVPDDDIVDIYNASVHGHKMFIDTAELWQEITERGIDLNDYRSAYDGEDIPVYDKDSGAAEPEKQTEAVTETESETDSTEASSEETDISEENDPYINVTEISYPDGKYDNEPASQSSRDDVTAVTEKSTKKHTYTESSEHTYTTASEIYENETDAAETTVTAETSYKETTLYTETESSVNTSASQTTVTSEKRAVSRVTEVSETSDVSDITTVPDSTSDTDGDTSRTERVTTVSKTSIVSDITTVPDSTSDTDSKTSRTESSSAEAVTTEPEVHVHKFEEYISDGNATCTEDGTKTAVCSCGERDTVTDVGSAGHKEAREVTEATFISEGNIRIYCSVCGETLANEALPRAPLYIDDGSLVISETGFKQGGGDEIPYTGDYNISQRSSTPASSSITVVSGTHNINFNGIDTSTDSDTFTVENCASVTISGGNKENKFSASGDNCYGLYNNKGSVTIKSGIFNFSGSCGIFGTADSVLSVNSGYIFANGKSDGIRSSGAVAVSGGNISAYGGSNGIWSSGDFTAVGGNLSAAGGVLGSDIKVYKNAGITGGSVRAVNGKTEGKFVNSIGDELECEAFDVFPSETLRTFENSAGDKYVYGLTVEDKASDGYYYIWKPIGFTPKFDGTVYTDDGSITITADGITQGGKTVPWTEDITISQKDRSTAFDVIIGIESGTYNITLDGINIKATGESPAIAIRRADVTLNGSYKENFIEAESTGIVNYSRSLHINSGTYYVIGGRRGFNMTVGTSTTVYMNGGKMTLFGGEYDLGFTRSGNKFIVSGGSLKLENSTIESSGGAIGVITNENGDELECKVYSEYTGNLAFTDGDGNEYTYKLDVGDSIDGGYYVWQPKAPAPTGVEVSEENFPDTVFRNYVSDKFDKDSNGYLSDSEIEAVTAVYVNGTTSSDGGVTSLKGIEYFENMTSLDCRFNSDLTSLDVSNNTALELLNCSNTQITSLDVSKNIALEYLDCYKTKIMYFDLTNTSVKALTAGGCEHSITVTNGKFDTKTIDGFDYTRASDCAVRDKNNNIIIQDAMDANGVVSGITKGMKITYTYDCGQGFSATFTLVPDENSTFELETPEGVEVSEENFPDTVFREYVSTRFDKDSDGWLSDSEIAGVTTVNIGGTSSADGGVTSLKGIEHFSKLEELMCYYNSSLIELNVSQNTVLKELWCGNTQITSLNVSNNLALKSLGCEYTSITSLDVSNNTDLRHLNCNDTKIKSLDVSTCTALDQLLCYNTSIESLDVSNNTVLRTLQCYNSQIMYLDLGNNTNLTFLKCNDNHLAYIDISDNLNIIISNLKVSDNAHPITVTNGKFDTKTIDGFDHTRVSDLQGSVMDENGVLSSIKEGTNITYTYDCGQGKSETFTLVPDENSTFEPEDVPFNGTIYMDDGSVTITSDGFTQNGVFTEWNSFYTIKQNSSVPLDASITVESGMHDITLDGINISSSEGAGIAIKSGAVAAIMGTAKENRVVSLANNGISSEGRAELREITIYASGTGSGISGITQIIDGNVTAIGDKNGIYVSPIVESLTINTSVVNASGGEYGIRTWKTINIYGGSITASGLTSDISGSTSQLIIIGGSVKAEHNTLTGLLNIINFNGDTLVCTQISNYQGNINVTTANGTYTYTLSESDRNADGLFYVWLPEGFVNTASILDYEFEDVPIDAPEQVGGEDIPADDPEQSIPDMLLDAVITTTAAAAANVVDITIFTANIVIYLISILIKLWR